MQAQTLIHAFENNIKQDRFIGFIEGKGKEKSISFEKLYHRALGILYCLQEKGLGKGDYLILYVNNNEQFVDIFWACQFGGIIPIPLAVGISDQHRQKVFNVAKNLKQVYIYTDRKEFRKLNSYTEENAVDDIFNNLSEQAIFIDDISDISKQGEMAEVNQEDVAFIQFSSGSTSDPKGIVLKHRNLMVNIRGIFEGGGFDTKEVSLSWMPLTHDMGLIGFHLTPIVYGMNHFLMRTELFVRRPLYWLVAASEKAANILCSPNFGYKHFLNAYKRKGLNGIDLSNVRLIFNGAEPISVNLCNQFTGELTEFGLSKQSIFPVYGLAEASLAVTFPKAGEALKTLSVNRNSLKIGSHIEKSKSIAEEIILVSVGRPVKGSKLKICDSTGNEFPENTVGYIEISGQNVTEKIIGSKHASCVKEGWLNTGDIGFISDEELFIAGRYKEIIYINGQNYYPHDIESMLNDKGGFELGKIAIVGVSSDKSNLEEVLVFAVFKGSLIQFMPIISKIKLIISEQFGFEVHNVIPLQRIPKTTSGKIQRTLLASDYLSGKYSEVISQLRDVGNSNAVTPKEEHSDRYVNTIVQICKEALPDKSFTINDSLLEVGASSLALVEIHTGLDEVFPGQIEITDLVDHPTIVDLANFLKDKNEVTA